MDESFSSNSPRADEFNSAEDPLVREKEPVHPLRHTSLGRSNQIGFWGFLAALMIYELARGVFFISSSC